jgi:hypothetical protein
MKYVVVISPTECRQFETEAAAKAAYPISVILSDVQYRAKRALELKTEKKASIKQPKNLNWFQRNILRKKPKQPIKE